MNKLFSLFVFLIFALATCINAQEIIRDDNAGLRGLRPGRMHVQQLKPLTITKNIRTVNAAILPGVCRLVPQQYATIQAAIDASVHGDNYVP